MTTHSPADRHRRLLPVVQVLAEDGFYTGRSAGCATAAAAPS